MKGGGQDKNAQEKRQVEDVLGTCLWSFPRCLWLGEKKHQHKKGENVPRFPSLVALREKYVSGVIFHDFLKGLRLQKKGF